MRTTVNENDRVVLYRDGRFERVLGPGRHRRLGRRTRIRLDRVWVAPQLHVVAGQEVLTADALGVKASLAVTWRVAEPHAFSTAGVTAGQSVHVEVQLAFRELVSARTLDELLSGRTELGPATRELAAPRLVDYGIELVAVGLRDLVPGPEVRRALASVVLAREEGRAALERARGEVAATRALLNAARLLDEHPGLGQLRTLQAISDGNATVVLNPR
jgi:regulator of protease activity HflC (stomatin/prohibitin superfamily)